jgi:hypothetical protein
MSTRKSRTRRVGALAATATAIVAALTSLPAAALELSITEPAAGGPPLQADFSVRGVADAGSTVRALIDSQPVGQPATADEDGAWSLTVYAIPTGAHSLQASATDVDGNVVTTSALSIDVDGHRPTAEITEPINYSVFLPGEPIVVEGVARDTNGHAFAGMAAVEINIHNPLQPTFRPGGLPVGAVITQTNSDCPACTTSSGTVEVEWSYDASWLPSGTYTIQVEPFDKAGNTSVQPQSLVIVKL